MKRKSQYKKIKPALTSATVQRGETKTPLGAIVDSVVSIHSVMSSTRYGAKAIGFDPRRVNVTIGFRFPDSCRSLTISSKRDLVVGAVMPEFSEKTFKKLAMIGVENDLANAIEKGVQGMIDRAQAAAVEANASVGFDRGEWFGED